MFLVPHDVPSGSKIHKSFEKSDAKKPYKTTGQVEELTPNQKNGNFVYNF